MNDNYVLNIGIKFKSPDYDYKILAKLHVNTSIQKYEEYL